jgi:twitching motility two-component system response regulator PilH
VRSAGAQFPFCHLIGAVFMSKAKFLSAELFNAVKRDVSKHIKKKLHHQFEGAVPGRIDDLQRAARRIRDAAARVLLALPARRKDRGRSSAAPDTRNLNITAMASQKILVVDDSLSQRLVLNALLTKEGHRVIMANDGEEAVAKAKSELPDLIIMDIIMPGLNGFQATRAITNDETTWHIPVILLTSKDMDSDRIWALRQGATAFLNKPLDHVALMALIETLA